jgi:pimeloyl-ACP methyl ester carboxylesterase
MALHHDTPAFRQETQLMTEHDAIPVPQGKRVQANGLNIYYEEYGVGRPLLLLHGGGSTGRGSWSRVAPILAKHFRVITPDSRGHGRTNNPDGKLSFRRMADDVVALAAALALEKPLICGWSDGGYIALEIGIDYDGFAGAIIANGIHFIYDDRHIAVTRQFFCITDGDQVDPARLERENPSFVEYLRTQHSALHGPEHWKTFVQQLAALWLAPFDLSAARLGQISVPMLISVGDRDDDSPLEQAVAAFRLIPRGELAVAPHSTHMFPVGNPELMAHTMFEFFRRHTGEDAPT